MKAVIIGCSGHYQDVLRSYERHGGFHIVGIAPGTPLEKMALLSSHMKQYGIEARCYEDYKVMLEREKPDVAIVNTFCHVSQAIILELLRREIHIFCEKPLATSIEGLVAIRKAYEKSGAKIGCMFGTRYESSFLTARHLISQGAIGEIVLMNAQKSYKLGRRGGFYQKEAYYGGIIPWVGIHAIDFIRYLSDETFQSVYATKSKNNNKGNGELEMAALCQIQLSGGIQASVTMDFHRPSLACSHGDDRIRVVGTDGVLEIRDHGLSLLHEDAQPEGIVMVEEECGFQDFLRSIRDETICRITPEDIFQVTQAAIYANLSANDQQVKIIEAL